MNVHFPARARKPWKPVSIQEACEIGVQGGLRRTPAEIGRNVDRDAKTVRTLLNGSPSYFNFSGTVLKKPKRPGQGEYHRHLLLETVLLAHFIIWQTTDNPARSGRQICSLMNQRKYCFARQKTVVERMIASLGIRSTWSIKKPVMTARHVAYRKRFADLVVNCPAINLPWVFTDECSIQKNPNRVRIHKVPGVKSQKRFQAYEGFAMRIMVFAGISHDYKSPLIWVQGSETAKVYQQVIEQSGIMRDMDGPGQVNRGKWVFQDDGASPHRATATRDWLRPRCLILPEALPWPAHSPDLNPIERLWNILKGRMDLSICNTQQEIFAEAVRAWDSIEMSIVNKCVDSFKDRLNAVRALQGDCLNDERLVIQQIQKQLRTPEEIQAERAEIDRRLIEFAVDSNTMFGNMLKSDSSDKELARQSLAILDRLPEKTKRKVLGGYLRLRLEKLRQFIAEA